MFAGKAGKSRRAFATKNERFAHDDKRRTTRCHRARRRPRFAHGGHASLSAELATEAMSPRAEGACSRAQR